MVSFPSRSSEGSFAIQASSAKARAVTCQRGSPQFDDLRDERILAPLVYFADHLEACVVEALGQVVCVAQPIASGLTAARMYSPVILRLRG
jgi:hypothetical protein